MIKNKFGQIGYFTTVLLVLIGFAFFGIFVIQNTPGIILTGEVVTDVNLPDGCSDAEIQAVWDSVFWESSGGISIFKNDSLVGGRCAEYFASKSDSNEINNIYVLYGYTQEESGGNVSYVFAEKINATSVYRNNFLDKITDIKNVSSLAPSKDSSFFETYAELRAEAVNLTSSGEIFNETFEMNFSELWISETYLNHLGYGFSDGFSNDTYSETRSGKISSNYSYAVFSFGSEVVEVGCVEDIECGNWSVCVNQSQNRSCSDANDCSGDYVENRTCGVSCTPLWNWSNWSGCVGGLQSRSVWDENSCGNNTGKPALNQSCSVGEEVAVGIGGCVSDWDCGDWTPKECPDSGRQTRVCNDNNECDVSSLTKTETQSCAGKTDSDAGSNLVFVLVILVVVGLIIGIILFLFKFAKKKEDEKNRGSAPFGGGFSGIPPTKPSVPMKSSQKISLAKKPVRPMQRVVQKKSIIQKPLTTPKISVPVKKAVQAKPVAKNSSVPVTRAVSSPSLIPVKKSVGQTSKQVSPAKKASSKNVSIKEALNQIANSPKKSV